jgi:hypothetical protein
MPEPTSPEPFSIEIEDSGTTALVRCHGKLLVGNTDLLHVPVSHLLAALVRIYVGAQSKGCALELRHLGPKIRDLLILTNLLPAFTITGERNIRM